MHKPRKFAIICSLLSVFAALPAFAQSIIAPDSKASVFSKGTISTDSGEFAPTFSPDGKTVYFTGASNSIYFSKLKDGKWTKPSVANFSGRWKDMDPFMSPDGKKIFFSSYRPYNGTAQLKFAHIWFVDRVDGDTWSEAHHMDPPINLDGVNNYAPAISRSGTIYFYSPNRDINNKSSYFSTWVDDHYSTPVLVPIAGDGGVHDPFISPDERYLIFASGGQLFISFRKNSQWMERQKLDSQVNDGSKNSSPCVSPDGKTLYYSSSRENGILMIPVNVR
ncbi:MAG: hypothetical protein JWR09_3581 [Mucilaginibacter sp.]|nr:hypothetical protein [Mucilaginibacter sp.]